MQQILVEAAVLGTAAAAVGIVIGALLIKIGSSLPPILSRTPVASASAIDGQLVAIVALVGAFSAAGIGLAPALFVSFRSPISHPAGFKPFWSWSGFRISARQVLLAVQVALATVLALTAGLLLHSLARIAAVASDHSEPARVLTGRVTAIAVPVDQRPAFFDSLLRGLNTLPGAESASFSANRLFEIGSAPVSLPGSDHGEIPTGVGFSAAGFFATVGIPLVAGREFDGSDDDQRHGLVINRVLADRVWPGDSAIGRQVPLLGEARTVTGVITESRCRSLLGPSEPCAYLPFVPTFSGGIVHVRAQGDPMTLVQPVRDLLRELNPHVALTDVRTLDGQIRYITAAQRLSAFLSAALAAIGILLLAAGCVSLFVSMVRDSARELAIRLAVGASMGTVTRRVLLQGLALVAAGLAMGSIAGRFVAVRLAEQLHEVAPSDPLTWTLVPVLVATVSLLSVYWAGRLAARTDPAQLLRAD
jgi:hypothetical protein